MAEPMEVDTPKDAKDAKEKEKDTKEKKKEEDLGIITFESEFELFGSFKSI